jgi:hypothetical protein
MSEVLATRSRAPSGAWSYVAVGFALAAAFVWVLAGVVDDGLYAVTGVLGIAGFGAGLKGRREAKRTGARGWPSLAAIALGGLLGGAVVVFTVVYVLADLL